MKKCIALFLAAVLVFSVCGGALAECLDEETLSQLRTGYPWVCVDLEGVVTEEMAADARDNFALFANRDFYLNTRVPEGYFSAGTINDVDWMNESDLLALFDNSVEAESDDARQAKALFDLAMDWESRNEVGMSAFSDQVFLVDAITTVEELNRYLLETDLMDVMEPPFTVDMIVDPENPDAYVAMAIYPDMTLEDPAEYADLTEWGQYLLDARNKFTIGLLEHLGYTQEEAQQKCDNAFSFERIVAPALYTTDELASTDIYEKAMNYLSRLEMLELQGNLPVVQMLEDEFGYGTQEKWMALAPDYFEAMREVYSDENMELITDWMICAFLRRYAEYMDRTCYDLMQECTSEIYGITPQSDEQNALNLVEQFMPWQVSRLFCETYFDPQDKEELNGFIRTFIVECRQLLSQSEYISEETRTNALKKLDTLTVNCLYPDDWSVFGDVDISLHTKEEGGTLYEALRRISSANVEQVREQYAQPVDRSGWSGDVPQFVSNCYYNPADNSINILAGFCRGGIYSSDMSLEEKYGKICMIVGHEIFHAFDSTGSLFDATGAYSSWWAENDKEEFRARVDKLADYLSWISLWEGEPVDGAAKTDDAIADMTAMQCVLKMASRIEGFDYDVFFRSYADLLASVNSLFMIQVLQMDGHAQDYIRINSTVQQFDEFLETYGVREGDAMYLAPEDRVLVW